MKTGYGAVIDEEQEPDALRDPVRPGTPDGIMLSALGSRLMSAT